VIIRSFWALSPPLGRCFLPFFKTKATLDLPSFMTFLGMVRNLFPGLSSSRYPNLCFLPLSLSPIFSISFFPTTSRKMERRTIFFVCLPFCLALPSLMLQLPFLIFPPPSCFSFYG